MLINALRPPSLASKCCCSVLITNQNHHHYHNHGQSRRRQYQDYKSWSSSIVVNLVFVIYIYVFMILGLIFIANLAQCSHQDQHASNGSTSLYHHHHHSPNHLQYQPSSGQNSSSKPQIEDHQRLAQLRLAHTDDIDEDADDDSDNQNHVEHNQNRKQELLDVASSSSNVNLGGQVSVYREFEPTRLSSTSGATARLENQVQGLEGSIALPMPMATPDASLIGEPSSGGLIVNASNGSSSTRMETSSTNQAVERMAKDCALILKRTYILKNKNPDPWGDKFVFNDVDPDDEKPKVHKTDLCIKHSDVDKAIEEAKLRLKFEKPSDLESLDVSVGSIAAVGELSLETGHLLAKKFKLSHDEILNALPMIDMSSSRFFWRDHLCPRHVRQMACGGSHRYRTISAHCNNLNHASWGAANTPYSRYLPPDYADGLDLPRASHSGQPLPSARLISAIIHRDHENPSNDHSGLFASWGQLLNHDVTRAALGESPDCCPQYLKGLCMPIPVPPSDPFYSQFNLKCLKFDRTPPAVRPKCLLGLRAQINTVTSPIDASFVYGSSKQVAQKLRKFSDGKMKVSHYFDHLKPLLPAKTEKPDEDCLGRPKRLFCFEAGDERVNEQTHLTILHTVYVREHNRIAKQLAKLNLDWDDDKIYHETRHIVAASVQHVMVNEFLPLLLGPKLTADYQLKPHAEPWTGYDASVTTSTGTGFAAAAFRYGHSMVDGGIKWMDLHGAVVKAEPLRALFKRPFALYEPGAVDELIMGMVGAAAEQTDPFVTEELSGHLFQPPKAKFGHDLAAINIQRGRDQGVPGYNEWREWCGLPRAKHFSDLEPLMTKGTASQYAKIYRHVDDVDLWSAGISERKLPGAAVGPTMACIIARQFMNSKRGDRFWFENTNQPSSFTAKQLREIKKISLAKILCTNSDHVTRIQPWAMRLPHPIYNAKVACDSLPSMDLKHWDRSFDR